MTMTNTDKSSKFFTLLAMTLGFVVVQLDVTVVNVATKTIGSSIGGSISGLQWVVNAYTLTFAAMILTAGALGDRIGAKRVFIAGFAVFTLASLGCGLSPNLPFLIAARATQGIGASILVPCSLTLLNHTYTETGEKTRAIGIWAAGASMALAAGPIAGGALIALAGWRSIFFINLPLGIAGIWLTIKYAAETPASRGERIDIWGQVVAVISLTLLAASMIQGGKQGWLSPWVIGGFVAFIIFASLFIFTELKVKNPMLPLSLFKIRTFSATTAVGFLLNASFYGLIFVVSLYFQQIRSYTPLKAGLSFLPMMLAVFLANLLAGRLAKSYSRKILIIAGTIIFLAGCVLLLRINAHTPFLFIAPQLIAMGFGVGLVVPPMTSAMLDSIDKNRSGLASGVLNAMRQTGSVVGVALFGSLIANRSMFLRGIHLSLAISAVLLGVSVVVGGVIVEKSAK